MHNAQKHTCKEQDCIREYKYLHDSDDRGNQWYFSSQERQFSQQYDSTELVRRTLQECFQKDPVTQSISYATIGQTAVEVSHLITLNINMQ